MALPTTTIRAVAISMIRPRPDLDAGTGRGVRRAGQRDASEVAITGTAHTARSGAFRRLTRLSTTPPRARTPHPARRPVPQAHRQEGHDQREQPQMGHAVEVGRLPFVDVRQPPVARVDVAQRVQDPDRSGGREHHREQAADERGGHPATSLGSGHRCAAGKSKEAVQEDDPQPDHPQAVDVGPQHEERDQPQGAARALRPEAPQEDEQDGHEQPADGLRADGHVRDEDPGRQDAGQGHRPQRDATADEREGENRQQRARDEPEQDERRQRAHRAHEEVHEDLAQPLVQGPGLAVPGERERIGGRDLASVDDQLPGPDVGEEVGIGQALGQDDDHHDPGQPGREDGGRRGEPQHAGESSRCLRAPG